jgi:hypothetical protein
MGEIRIGDVFYDRLSVYHVVDIKDKTLEMHKWSGNHFEDTIFRPEKTTYEMLFAYNLFDKKNGG